MTNMPTPPNQPLFPPPQGPKPRRYARMVGDYVRMILIMLFWSVLLCAALSGAFLACRAMYWALLQVLKALGG